ncbi:glycosyltransferase, partial [Veillonella parvula]
MATYNEKPNIIKSSIQSILDQSYSNFELLIFD